MHFATVLTVSALSVLSTAGPSAIQPRQAVNTVYLGLYSNSSCAGTTGGDVDHIHLTGSGYHNCFATTVKQSVAVSQSLSGACTIQAWSETDCSGSSTVMSNNGCHDTAYASISVFC